MVDAECFVLSPVLVDSAYKLPERLEMLSNRVLDNNAVKSTSGGVAMFLEILSYWNEHTRWNSQIKDAVTFFYFVNFPNILKIFVQIIKITAVVVVTGYITKEALEGINRLDVTVWILDVRGCSSFELFLGHFRACIPYDVYIVG